MDVRNLKPGKSIEINIEKSETVYHYVTKIEVVDDKTVYVTVIKDKLGEPLFINGGDSTDFVYRVNDKLWKWPVAKAGRGVYQGEILQMFTVKSYEGLPYNRRESFRVFFGTEIDVRRTAVDMEKLQEYRQNHPEIKDPNDFLKVEELFKTITVQVVLKDLSETGVGLLSKVPLPERAELSLTIPTEFGLIHCVCVPVRSSVDYEKEYRHFYGCKIQTVSANISRILVSLQRRQMALNRFDKKN